MRRFFVFFSFPSPLPTPFPPLDPSAHLRAPWQGQVGGVWVQRQGSSCHQRCAHPSSCGTALPIHQILASLALWLLLRPLRCCLVRSPLLCSALLPTLSPQTGARLAWRVLPGSSSGTVPVLQPGGFSCCCFSVFPPCPADPLETGSVFGLGEGPSAAQPGLGVLQAPGGSDPSPCSAQPGCARAAIPALPHPHPRVRRAHVGFAVGLSTTALTPIPSSCPGFGLCPRVNPSRSFPS